MAQAIKTRINSAPSTLISSI